MPLYSCQVRIELKLQLLILKISSSPAYIEQQKRGREREREGGRGGEREQPSSPKILTGLCKIQLPQYKGVPGQDSKLVDLFRFQLL